MLPDPTKYISIHPYESGWGWIVRGTTYSGSETIKSGFNSKALAQAWQDEYLRAWVRKDSVMLSALFES